MSLLTGANFRFRYISVCSEVWRISYDQLLTTWGNERFTKKYLEEIKYENITITWCMKEVTLRSCVIFCAFNQF